MKIITAHWSSVINFLSIRCDCGKRFSHRVDRWRVICPHCGNEVNINKLREDWTRRRRLNK